jgi:hypothetical protein
MWSRQGLKWCGRLALGLAVAAPALGQNAPAQRVASVVQDERASDRITPLRDQTPSPALEFEEIDDRLLEDAMRVTTPSERALALERTARAKILVREFDDAEKALEDGGIAAAAVPAGTLRDVRIAAVVNTSMLLTDELVQAASSTVVTTPFGTESEPLPRTTGSEDLLLQATRIWRRAAELARTIGNDNVESESMHRIAATAARSAADLARRYQGRGRADQPESGDLESLSPERVQEFTGRAMLAAEDSANQCKVAIWRDYTLATICGTAGNARLFEESLPIARRIASPAYRTIALVSVADSMVQAGNPESTAAFSDAALAVASIRGTDPRISFGNILIDSLISAGRFRDARQAVGLLPTERSRTHALGAVARSMGERGKSDEAFQWINSEAPEPIRGFLKRAVNDGLLRALERSRLDQMNMGM